MPVVENECPEGNAEGLKILRESLKKVQISADTPSDATHVFVVFGASGDLAKKKTFPAIFQLHLGRVRKFHELFWAPCKLGMSKRLF